MELEESVLQGILLFPPQGMLGQLKKTWHKRFCQLFKASKYGIERLEIYDNQEEAIMQQHSPRIITLEACVKIAPSNQPHVFTVMTKSGIHHFGCSSETDMTNWITAFQSVAFKDNIQNSTIEEDNDLYCTSGEGVFSVKVVETEASRRCGLESKSYTLIVAAVDIKLMDGDNVLYTWPYRYIRRYGYRDGKFTFEAGRKCESGEGSFRLEHSNQQEIFRCISSKMKSMKKLLNGENSSPSIECNDAQYHAALSMEAGSRSPLPPSPNSSTSIIDLDFSTISQNSQKLNASVSSSESVSLLKPSPIVKPKPAKPPRKYIFTTLLDKNKSLEVGEFDSSVCGKYKKLSSSDSSEFLHKSVNDSGDKDDDKHSYDLVEVRSDAWKTHGIDRVLHRERMNPTTTTTTVLKDNNNDNDRDESQYETVAIGSSKSVVEPLITTSPIIHNNVPGKLDQPNYDKLQYFGSTHKLNHNPGYKTPNVLSIAQSSQYLLQSTTSNDVTGNSNCNNYDIVEDMCAVRLADDSHLGYGMIRKKSNHAATGPKHKIYNNSEYAIVSKPKRV